MKYITVVLLFLLALASGGITDLNRTTGLIDMPIAEVLPHGTIRGGISISFSDDSPNREENFNFSFGLFDRVEASLGVLSREAVELNILYRILEEGTNRPAVAIGVWDITHKGYVSDPGYDSAAYSDELAYGTNRPREQFSGFCVLSKSITSFARIHAGLGRGRFVGWGPRSKYFKLGDQPNSAVGLFLGFDAEAMPGLRFFGELDGRDVNLGIRYSKRWLRVDLGLVKLEHLLFNSSEYSPRLVLGSSVAFPLVKKLPEEVPMEKLHLHGSLSGRVLDAESWEPIEASVKLIGTNILEYTDPTDGTFLVEDVTPGQYVVEVNAPGYRNKMFTISIEPNKVTGKDFYLSSQRVEKEIEKREIETKKRVIIDERIYFKPNRVEFLPESKKTLEKVAKVLKENPEVKLEIRGYSDSVGSQEYNLILSKNRAGVVKAYLVQAYGIDPDRLAFEGYGESNPVGDNSTSEGRALNRRVEFIVIE